MGTLGQKMKNWNEGKTYKQRRNRQKSSPKSSKVECFPQPANPMNSRHWFWRSDRIALAKPKYRLERDQIFRPFLDENLNLISPQNADESENFFRNIFALKLKQNCDCVLRSGDVMLLFLVGAATLSNEFGKNESSGVMNAISLRGTTLAEWIPKMPYNTLCNAEIYYT